MTLLRQTIGGPPATSGYNGGVTERGARPGRFARRPPPSRVVDGKRVSLPLPCLEPC